MESYFAADIGEGSLQSSILPSLVNELALKLRCSLLQGLPAAVVEHHRKNLTENIILEGPDGHKLAVMLGQSRDLSFKPCLLQGWREFVTDCNLAVNDPILFLLQGCRLRSSSTTAKTSQRISFWKALMDTTWQ